MKIKNQHLSSLRDWLLPMLMNGQVKVDLMSRGRNEPYTSRDTFPGDLLPLAAEPAEAYAANRGGK